jgi:SAM-dependent methyltransferase
MQRTLQPELLDSLPPDHPDALRNRRDIRLTNRVIGTHRWLERILPLLLHSTDTVLEIGAGTGELGLRLAHRGVKIAGLDLWPRPVLWPVNSPWHREDLRAFGGYGDYRVIIGNLIFHQFSDADLAALGTKLQSARLIVACEPQRRRLSQVLYRTLAPLLGANYVSLHDAHVSIAAGFRGDELAEALGLRSPEWEVRCASTLLGTHRMIAIKTA